MNRLSLEEFKQSRKLPLVVVLDDVRSLYNVGSVFRSCDAFRIEAIYVYSVEQVEGSTPLQTLSEQISPITNGADAKKHYAVVLGNEVKGVHQSVVDLSDSCLEIPQFGTKHSLNVSITAGIVVWEFARALLL